MSIIVFSNGYDYSQTWWCRGFCTSVHSVLLCLSTHCVREVCIIVAVFLLGNLMINLFLCYIKCQGQWSKFSRLF